MVVLKNSSSFITYSKYTWRKEFQLWGTNTAWSPLEHGYLRASRLEKTCHIQNLLLQLGFATCATFSNWTAKNALQLRLKTPRYPAHWAAAWCFSVHLALRRSAFQPASKCLIEGDKTCMGTFISFHLCPVITGNSGTLRSIVSIGCWLLVCTTFCGFCSHPSGQIFY